MKYNSIKKFLDEHTGHIAIDKKLTKKLRNFRYSWSTKSDEYIDFLGSNLLGVHVIRFSILDDEMLMTDLFKIKNYLKLDKEIYQVDGIEEEFNIASNIIYQTLMYLAHQYLTGALPKKEKEDGIRELCLLLQYKMFTSLYSRYFLYPTPEVIANTVYNKLSHKFLIKRLDNWQELFEYRVQRCMDKESPNHKQLKLYNTKASIDLLSAIQTKLRGNVKEIYAVLMDVIENDEVGSLSSVTYVGGEDGVEQVSDVVIGSNIYITRVKNIAQQPNDFLDLEIVKIVNSTFTNIDERLILDFIKCMSNEEFVTRTILDPIIENIMVMSFGFLQRSGINVEDRGTLPKALINMRFYWSSSKVTNSTMVDVKEKLYDLAHRCTGRKTNWILITLSLTYIVYVFLRSLKN